MRPDDSARFRNTLTGMFRMYRQEPDGLVLDAYWIALRDWSVEDFEGAARHLMQTAKFMPLPAEFNELRKAGRPTAGEAWADALDAVRHSQYPTDDLLLERAVRAIGGWKALGMTTDEGLPFIERRFAEHFESIQDADDIREAVPSITHEQRLDGPVRRLLRQFNIERNDA